MSSYVCYVSEWSLMFDDQDNGCQLVGGGEKSERLSKCWLKLWRWRCTWNDQTNTSYALGHLGNLDILWELENVVVICIMNYIFCWEPGWQKTSWISWKSGYFGTDRLFCWLHWIRSFESQVGRRHCQISRSPLFLGLLNARPPRLELCNWSEPLLLPLDHIRFAH